MRAVLLIRLWSATTRGGQRPLHKEIPMPLFLIERNFAEQLEVNRDGVAEVTQVNAGHKVSCSPVTD